MRRISAQYVFTSAGRPLKRGIVSVAGDGTVVSVEDTGGDLAESAGTEFYNGILLPGFINCHAHLELSHMRSIIPPGCGLSKFISAVGDRREASYDEMTEAAAAADREMQDEGVVACGDISNNPLTASVKRDSAIRYLTFAEVFGLDPSVAETRMESALKVVHEMNAAALPAQVTPHSAYSLSPLLWQMVMEKIPPGTIISLHFLESDDERKMSGNHLQKARELSGLASRLLLVHNTVISHDEAVTAAAAGNTWFCLCPSSNMHISGIMPPVQMLSEVTDRIAIGTDSLASTGHLSMLGEMRLLHEYSPSLLLEDIIRWGTLSGARALGMDDSLGSIEPGKKPGLLLVEHVDLINMRLLPESRVRRLL